MPNTNSPILEWSSHLAYILGVLKGDGSVFRDFNTNSIAHVIKLSATSETFANSFLNELKAIGLNPSIRQIQDKRINRKDKFRVLVCSKIFYDWYYSIDKKRLVTIAKAYPEHFLRGLYESDGDQSNNRPVMITISNTNKEIIELACIALNSLEFRYSITTPKMKSNRRQVYRLRILGGNSERKRFMETIKPCIRNHIWTDIKPHWTKDELNKLAEKYQLKSCKELAKDLGRSEYAVLHKLSRKHLYKHRNKKE